ncbi:MAG: universal stress protein [Tetrasphaera sp.]|nr:universal stress protein [Tetrasphaera sp.]
MDAVKPIVPGSDASPSSQLALDWAVTTAEAQGRGIRIVHALPIESIPHLAPASPFGWNAETPIGLTDVKDEAVTRAVDRLGDDRVSFGQVPGSPAARLVAQANPGDLLVTGTRGHGVIRAALLGSTAYAVAAHAPCPVVIVRAPENATAAVRPGPDHPVLVGIDDVETSQAALDEAATWAAASGAVLRIVRAVEVDGMAFAAAPLFVSDLEFASALKDHADDVIAAAVDHVRSTHPDLEIKASVVPGRPGIVLGHEARGAGLAVVGSRGRGGFAGLALGSVSHHLIHDAACPVMVAR